MCKKIYKQLFIYVLSFFVPVIIYALAWSKNEILYNGNVTPLISDLLKEIAPNIASLRYVWNGDNSVFFNWAADMGGDYYSLIALHLGSPLNIITLLWDLEDFANAIYVLILLKIGLCGLSFCFFVNRRFRNKCNQWIDVIFCCSYALMSYVFTFGICIMWIDTLILLPVVMLGIEQLIERKKSILYILMLALIIVINFYAAISACFFIFFYFLYRLASLETEEKKGSSKLVCSFFLHSFTAALLSMPLNFSVVLRLFENIRMEKINEASMEHANNAGGILQFIKMIFPFQYDGIGISEYQLPYIFCGTGITLLCILYFFTKDSVRRKTASLILILPAMIGFMIPGVNFVWHGFQMPHGFDFRYSYVFSIGMIIIAIQCYEKIVIRKTWGKIAVFLISVLCLFELEQNGTYLIKELNKEMSYESREQYISNVEYYQAIKDILESYESPNSFYRVAEDIGFEGRNAGLMFNIPGTTYFSSSLNIYLNNLMITMGGDSTTRFTSMSGATSLLNSFMGNKYLISSDRQAFPYEKIADLDAEEFGKKLYRNQNIIEGGVLVPDGAEAVTVSVDGVSPLDMNNVLMYFLSGQMAYTKVPFTCTVNDASSVTLQINTEEMSSEVLYLYIGNIEHNNGTELTATVTSGDNIIRKSSQEGKKRLLRIPVVINADQEEYTIKLDNVEAEHADIIMAFQVDSKLEQAVIEDLHGREMQNVTTTKYGYKGNISSAADALLMFSVPYDKGWKIYVDGEQKSTECVMNTFAAVKVTEGEHIIEIRFIPYGLNVGIVLGVLGILLMLLIFWPSCSYNKSRKCNDRR